MNTSKHHLKMNNKETPKLKKLTKTKEREFFKLIKDEEFDHSDLISEMLIEYPDLANSTVSGMTKGIDGFSSLMLAIRFYNFDVAKILVRCGANVNFIDSSGVRKNHAPVFFDFIEIMRDLIEVNNIDEIKNGFELWDLMDSHGLDYSLKSIPNDGVNKPDNFVYAFIRLIGAKYNNKHLVHKETTNEAPNKYTSTFRLSTKSQDMQKESSYLRMAEKIVNNVSVEQLREVDANRYRSWSSTILPFFIENGFVDKYSLHIINKLTKKKHGFELKNMHDINHITNNIDKRLTRFTYVIC